VRLSNIAGAKYNRVGEFGQYSAVGSVGDGVSGGVAAELEHVADEGGIGGGIEGFAGEDDVKFEPMAEGAVPQSLDNTI
jgi:hypothetical protein